MRRSAVVVLIAALALGACQTTRADPGPTETRNVPVGAFSAISSGGSYQVNVKTGGAPAVVVRGPRNVLDQLSIAVADDELQIGSKRNHDWRSINFGRHEPVVIEVTAPSIRRAVIAGSGDMSVDRVSGDSFTGSIAGSGSLNVGNVAAKTVALKIAGSGNANAAGKADAADYNIAGSGSIIAGGLETADLKASVAGSGNVEARATRAADISIIGSGDATISGGAKCTTHKMGSGSVTCS